MTHNLPRDPLGHTKICSIEDLFILFGELVNGCDGRIAANPAINESLTGSFILYRT
jgi:hypothetical protein